LTSSSMTRTVGALGLGVMMVHGGAKPMSQEWH